MPMRTASRTHGTGTPPAEDRIRPAGRPRANSEIAGRLRHAGGRTPKIPLVIGTLAVERSVCGVKDDIAMGERDPSHPERSSRVSVESARGGEHHRPVQDAVHFAALVTELGPIGAEHVDDAIRTAMGRLLDPLDLDHCAVFRLSTDGQDLRLTHHQTRTGMPEPPSAVSRTEYPWTLSRVVEGELVYVASLDEVPTDIDRESLGRWAGTSFAACPLTIDGAIAGTVCFSSQRPLGSMPWGLERLCLVAHVFGSALGSERAHAALQSSQQRFQTIVDEAPAMIWISGPDKRSTWFNRQWLAFVGHTLDEEIRSGRTGSVHPEDLAACVATYETSFDARRPFSMEYRLRRCDGEWRWVLDNGAPNFAGGEFAGYVGTCLDITDQKEALEGVVRRRDELHLENVTLKREVKERRGFDIIVGESAAIRSVLVEVERVAATDATVLLLGETGTGKELFATRIHELSARRSRTMVRVNCAAIPPTLIESELFGRERGAFTGALARQVGRFELADHSTIFLDEIGDLSIDIQVKLLRVLEERQIERLGSPRAIRVDTRIIAATHRDLEARVSEGTFREDLFYRLNVFPIHIPPLRERVDDIPLLVWRFVVDMSKALGKRIETIPQQNMHALMQYAWPGNVRELRNRVDRAVALARAPMLGPADLFPEHFAQSASEEGLAPLHEVRDAAERRQILRAMEQTGGRVTAAAQLLGVSRTTLWEKMQRLGL